MRVFYLPIENYGQRNTGLTEKWTVAGLLEAGMQVDAIHGAPHASDREIEVGKVLDARARAEWSGTQMACAISLIDDNAVDGDMVFVEDMFTPGFEALPYFIAQDGRDIGIVTRNYAQSVDEYDFTWPMRKWMRHYELMVDASVDAIFCASQQHKTDMQTAMFESHIEVTGLPFDSTDVRAMAARGAYFEKFKSGGVAYTSRWDAEKQPHLFIELVENYLAPEGVRAIVCTGAAELRGEHAAVRRAYELAEKGTIELYCGLSKADYLSLLEGCEVQFNCALQDWVSWTALEASALDTVPVAPAFRSFLERPQPQFTYKPWDIGDAARVVLDLIGHGSPTAESVAALANDADRSVARTAALIERCGRERREYRSP